MPNPNNLLGLDLDTKYEPTDVEEQVFDLLTAYLPAHSKTTPQKAAKKAHSFFPHHCLGEDDDYYPRQFLCEFWEVMFRVAPQLDYQGKPMQRYIALHKALQELPEIFIQGRYRVWQDRPYFGMELHERWSQMGSGTKITDPAHRSWRNMNGLLIHFNNEGISDGAYHALTCIWRHLEDDDRHRNTRTKYINVYPPVAALWFIHCSPRIYEACRNQEYHDRIPGGRLWKGEAGYNIPRWEFWRSRFEELKRSHLATEETIQACKVALNGMDAVSKPVDL